MLNQPFSAGALRYKDADGHWTVTEPHHPMYSTTTMLATEWWDSKTEEWRKIFDEEEGD